MTERPILFSAPMVRALLAGTKTQTRRTMGRQPYDGATVTVEHFRQTVIDRHGEEQPGPEVFGAWWGDGEYGLRCPYGQPDDRLWVREAVAEEYGWCDHPEMPGCPDERWHIGWHYRADGEPDRNSLEGTLTDWKPSIHMPRWASRITLEITEVRVERLQDISEVDAIAEGLTQTANGSWLPGPCDHPEWAYHQLWDQINGPGSWDANPWVWVLSFRRITP